MMTIVSQSDIMPISKETLQATAYEYSTGIIDIPEIARRLGIGWSENDVIILLERMGVHRPLSLCGLPHHEKNKALEILANLRKYAETERLNSVEWIQREVTASQRIE